MRRQPELKAKVVFMGNSGVGKTSIILRDIEKFTSDVTSTLGVNFVQSTIKYHTSKKLELELWDTVGTEKYSCTMPCYLHHANGVFLVFDVTNRRSFNDLSRWYRELDNACNIAGLSLILVGNKIDLDEERTVEHEEAMEFAYERDMIYMETSALQNQGVEEMMRMMTELLVDRFECRHLSSQSKIDKIDLGFFGSHHKCLCT